MQTLLEFLKNLFNQQNTSEDQELDTKQEVDIGVLKHRIDDLESNLKTALRRVNRLEKDIYELKTLKGQSHKQGQSPLS
ncbi:hypothetical protein T36_0227 [Helicobacter cinaedi]|uniref:hypothetical protein n=1 Tax=Helicobacter cinaedi TaxID=213 RepID=UPI001F20759F|nr:hypothetical protein [Helicobacter cinaedi]BDB63783.1 hypothetical protein T36_0227 [Helicobacter cinaedi]